MNANVAKLTIITFIKKAYSSAQKEFSVTFLYQTKRAAYAALFILK